MGRPSGIRPGYDGRASEVLKSVDLSAQPSGPYTFSGSDLSGISEHGGFHLAIPFAALSDFEGQQGSAIYLLKGDSGATRILYDATTHAFEFAHQGSSVFLPIESGQPWSDGDTVTLHLIRDPYSTILVGRMDVNGCITADKAGSGTSGAAISIPSSLYFGSDQGAAPYFTGGQILGLTAYKLHASPARPARVVVLGDSTTGPLSSASVTAVHPALASYFSMPSGTVAASIAKSGDKINDQKTTWQASRFRGAGEVRCVYASLGINDAIYSQSTDGASAATILARAQALVDDISTNNPDALILWELCTPCRLGLHVDAWAVLAAFNDLLRGGGLTGVDHLVTTAYDALDDGTGALRPEFEGDATHPNTAGTLARYTAILAELQAAGIVFPP